MNFKNSFLLLTLLFFTSGCYATIKGKVIDAETGQPIEGAVAMAEWTKTKGMGLTYTVSARVVETVSDKEGTIEISSCWCPFTNKPNLTVYKKGYVAWNNKNIFPSYKVREKFEWKDGQVFKLKQFAEGFTHTAHVQFVRHSINSTIGHEKKKKITNAIVWETKLSVRE